MRDLDIIDIKVVCILLTWSTLSKNLLKKPWDPKAAGFEHPLDIESWGQSQSKPPPGFCCDIFELTKFTMWNYSIPADTKKVARLKRFWGSNGFTSPGPCRVASGDVRQSSLIWAIPNFKKSACGACGVTKQEMARLGISPPVNLFELLP